MLQVLAAGLACLPVKPIVKDEAVTRLSATVQAQVPKPPTIAVPP